MKSVKSPNLIKPPIFVHSGIKAFFSTNSFNSVRNDIAKLINTLKDNIYLPLQRHTDRVHVLETDFKRKVADAVLTDRRGILIGVQVADCVPILLYDKEKNVVGAVHAGWRGTSKHILQNTIKTMKERFNSSAENILLAIGPCIRQCCYEIGADVMTAVKKTVVAGDYYHEHDDKYFLDLSSVNKIHALSMGILQQHIWQSDECTHCNPDRFYSYRHAKGSTGRQFGFIGMR